MATLFISEFSDLPFTSNGVIQGAAAQNWIEDQHITIAASSAPSAAFNPATTYVLLSTDAACSIAWTAPGATVNPATANNLFLPANMQPKLFGVAGGMIVSAITNT